MGLKIELVGGPLDGDRVSRTTDRLVLRAPMQKDAIGRAPDRITPDVMRLTAGPGDHTHVYVLETDSDGRMVYQYYPDATVPA